MTFHTAVKIVLSCTLALAVATKVAAQTIETETARVLPAHAWEVGYAFEAQTSSQGTEKAMPLAFEYGLNDKLELMIEPVPYTSIRPKTGRRARGAGDIEVTLTYKFHEETHQLPAFSVAGEVKVPTARDQLIGTGKTDYAGYFSASKLFGRLDTHAHVSYTFVGQVAGAQLGNIVGIGLAGVCPVTTRFDIFGEMLSNTASASTAEGGVGVGVPLVPEAAGGELVGTIGTSWHTRSWLTLYASVSRDNIGATLLRTGMVLLSR